MNPGSTSTKIAVYEDETAVLKENLRHDAASLAKFARVIDQYAFRKQAILDWLKSQGEDPAGFSAAVGRGGILRPILGGTYEVNDRMLSDLRQGMYGEHAANLGAALAREIAHPYGRPAFIVDPVVVDEMEPVARISGLPGMPRRSLFHALNQKAVARRVSRQIGKPYDECNLIVVHLGGGVTVGAHRKGRVIDVNNGLDGEGPFSPERAGTLPTLSLVNLCFSWKYTHGELGKMIVGRAGLVAHLGTNDAREVERMIAEGSQKAEMVYRAMAYQVAKEIGRAAVALRGEVGAVIITGGLAYSEMLVGWIRERIGFIGEIIVSPGEDEMQALAEGALRVLRGEEEPKIY